MFPAVLTTMLFAISAVCAVRTSRILGGTEANFWRVTLATLLLAVLAHTFGHGLSGSGFPMFLLSGLVGFGIGDLALYQSLPRIGSRLSIMLVHCLAAPLAALVEWLWLGTRITAPQYFAGFVILAGVALALAPDQKLGLTRSTLVTGISFGSVAGVCQGLSAVLSVKAYALAHAAGEPARGFASGITAAYQRILAGWVIGAGFYFLLKLRQRAERSAATGAPLLREKLRRAWPWVVGNALSGPSLGVSCFQLALASTPTAVVLPIVAVTPLAVIPLARVTEGERPGRRSILGGVIAVAGVVTLTWARFRQ